MMTKEQIDEIKNSYLTKEEFITLLENINFTHVKNIHVDLITGFKIRFNSNDEQYIDPLYIDLNIE